MKEEFEVGNYGIFTDGVVLTNSLKENVGDLDTCITSSKSVFSNHDVFLGPVADFVNQSVEELHSNISIVSDNFQKISDFLIQVNQNYQNSDSEASINLRLEGIGAIASDYENPANLSGYRLDPRML